MLTLTTFEQRYPVLHSIFDRIGTWLHDRTVARERVVQLNAFASEPELAQAARDLGLSRSELAVAMALSPGFVTMLGRRMALPLARRLAQTGIDRQRLRESEAPLLQELATRCAGCDQHGRCENDLDVDPASSAWQAYCPNARAIESLRHT